MKEHSEEYMKGYRCGYETARQKFEGKTKPDKSRLTNLCAIPPKIEWLKIDDIGGDNNSFFCSNCHTTFEEYEHFKFCPECGGRSPLADVGGDENGSDDDI